MMFRITEEDPDFVSYLIYARPKSAVDNNLTVCSAEGMEVTRAIVVEGQAAGEVRSADDRVLCGLISGTIMRLIDLRLDGVIVDPLTGLAEVTTDVIWSGPKTTRPFSRAALPEEAWRYAYRTPILSPVPNSGAVGRRSEGAARGGAAGGAGERGGRWRADSGGPGAGGAACG